MRRSLVKNHVLIEEHGVVRKKSLDDLRWDQSTAGHGFVWNPASNGRGAITFTYERPARDETVRGGLHSSDGIIWHTQDLTRRRLQALGVSEEFLNGQG